jgi:cell wall-associated NlpC family hydrolase
MHTDGNDGGVRLPANRRAYKRGESPAEKRKRIVKFAMRYYKHRRRIRYSQVRPSQLRWPRFMTASDCSGLVAAIMHHCRVLPQVDWRWTNTWVQITYGHEVTYENARPGDVVFYGTSRQNPTHEALYLGNGQVLSNGSYPMGIYSIDYRTDRVMIRSFL